MRRNEAPRLLTVTAPEPLAQAPLPGEGKVESCGWADPSLSSPINRCCCDGGGCGVG